LFLASHANACGVVAGDAKRRFSMIFSSSPIAPPLSERRLISKSCKKVMEFESLVRIDPGICHAAINTRLRSGAKQSKAEAVSTALPRKGKTVETVYRLYRYTHRAEARC
jgi:hypothetical protein